MSQRRGRAKDNVAGEVYNSNAVENPLLTQRILQQQQQQQQMMGGMGGMPDMAQMMEMMQKNMGGMGGMGFPNMAPPDLPPPRPSVLYPYGLTHGASLEGLFTFYPHYLNALKTAQQGRRLPKALACDDPTADEMSEVCTYLKLPHALEPNKKYPRDWQTSGRIRVRLTRPGGALENPDVKSRKELLVKMAELIPKLQSRKVRLEKEAAAAKQAAAAATGSGATAATNSKKKGKGKKGRR